MSGKWSSKNIASKENVLLRFSELSIFNYYLNSNFQEKDFFCNPMRNDQNPTCSFYRGHDGRLRMRDHAGHFHGDCFDLVQHIYRCGYYEAIQRIWDEMGARKKPPVLIKDHFLGSTATRKRAKIHVKVRSWDEETLRYWKRFHITQETLERYNVFPLAKVWVGENTYKQNVAGEWAWDNLIYGYYFGEDQWKIYFPLKKRMRFLSNTSCIQGEQQLEPSKYIVITKALKDVMVLHELGIPSIAPQTEHIVLKELDDMLLYYEAVFVLFDNDPTGNKGAVKYRQEGCIPLRVPKEKDISDFIRKFGLEQTQQLIDETKKVFGY